MANIKKLLWISLTTPYRKVDHAGGQALISHLDNFVKSGKFDIKMVSLCFQNEYQKAKESLVDVDVDILIEKEDAKTKIIDLENRINPWNRYGGYLSNSRVVMLKKHLAAIKKNGYKPDIIMLHWTEMIALVSFVKKLYPQAKIVAIEEDVSFLKRKRRYENHSAGLVKIIHGIRYKKSKKKELSWVNKTDLVATYNEKDARLLTQNGIKQEKVFVFIPVFNNMESLKREVRNSNILFWGAMNRMENIEAAMWLAQEVMPKLRSYKIGLTIMGAKPPKEIMDLENDNIHVTGYVDDASPYFVESMCMAAPLKNGAGIKIKILEGLSAGIPVITNDVGIEGIIAEDGVNYIHANTAQQYVDAIVSIYENINYGEQIGNNAKKMIREKFSSTDSISYFIQKCCEL